MTTRARRRVATKVSAEITAFNFAHDVARERGKAEGYRAGLLDAIKDVCGWGEEEHDTRDCDAADLHARLADLDRGKEKS